MKRSQAQVRLDTASTIPAYRQIADQLRVLIVDGVLAPGDALPPVRRLALELGIHFNTVAEAYRVLGQEEFLDITHGHGARVAGRTLPRKAEPKAADNFRRRLRELIAGVRANGVSKRQIAVELRDIAETLENQ
jgi:GntR family transcriptional regulator